jgi:hypothetical protein
MAVKRSTIMKADVNEALEVSRLELLRRAGTHHDLEAWAAFQQGLEETVLTWLHNHPGREIACRVQSERHVVAQAFEQVRQAVVQRQVTFQTLPEALLYLRASLSGAMLEIQRASSRPTAVSRLLPEEPCVQEQTSSSELWETVQTLLPNAREQRLAYLLFHCGLRPREIVRDCQEEWNDVEEVSRLRHTLVERLVRNMNQLMLTAHRMGGEMGGEERKKEES